MKKFSFLTIVFALIVTSSVTAQQINFQGCDSLGNHRAVIGVSSKNDAVFVHIPWRRRDLHPEEINILIYDAQTDKRVKNLKRIDINREFGEIVFQPQTVPGKYFVYYMPYTQKGKYYPKVTYNPPEETASAAWLSKNKVETDYKLFPEATFVKLESKDEFNDFTRMEHIASKSEIAKLLKDNPDKSFLVFYQDRRYPIRMTSDIPKLWGMEGSIHEFTANADIGEYFSFQLGVYPLKKDLEKVRIIFSDLKGSDGKSKIPASALTCFNLEGVNWDGKPMKKTVNIKKEYMQPLWIGVDIPFDVKPLAYTGKLTVTADNSEEWYVDFTINVKDVISEDRGDNEPWKHSRLRWLNSTLAENDNLIKPYTPVTVSGKEFSILGRTIAIDNLGFPETIKSFTDYELTGFDKEGREILNGPVSFVVTEKGGGEAIWKNKKFNLVKHNSGVAAWETENISDRLLMNLKAKIEFDGYVEYLITLTATDDIEIEDIKLVIPFVPGIAKYTMGMGQEGGYCADKFEWKWDVKKNQDAIWIGDVNAGMQLRMWDENYERPLNTNFYQAKPLNMPPSWYNEGKGGFNYKRLNDEFIAKAYTGKRSLKEGEELHFNFSLLITPFKPVDTKKHFANRYYHKYFPLDSIKEYGANVVNVHHATAINPYINYPFLRPDSMKAYINEAHRKDMRVKIYYTVRELSNHAPEVFALQSLNGEVFVPRSFSKNLKSYGKNGGYSWLQEHLLDDDYIAAWYAPNVEDAAILNTGVSRWHNYYIEGLNWLVDNVGIDGLYIDDLAFDRFTMKRIRKVLAKRPAPLIDLHSANQFNYNDGFANSANLYLEHFPYIDRLWFGEYFKYENGPDYWLIEVSGLPYGLMGEMLQDGGNPYRGMIYGMTARAPWSGNPAPLWKAWDDFGINDSRMIGYWVPYCPVKTDNEDVLATVYLKEGKVMVAIASWAENETKVKLLIDWEKLDMSPDKAKIYAPEIKDFQESAELNVNDAIAIEPGKGQLMIISE
jgi:hypothetical protein